MPDINPNRYGTMKYRRAGKSGLKLPEVSLGLWNNFGGDAPYDNMKDMIYTAFNCGITHIDIANNYGPPGGSAETNFGKILKDGLMSHRDELIISTKAGYGMWAGPYGDFGSKKYLVASLDQSLKRLGLEYVDIFYHHRPDPETPLEETMHALDLIVKQGKALYIGLSNYYNSADFVRANAILKSLGTPCLIHQPSYSMFNRGIEGGLIKTLGEEGTGIISFSPLAKGLLTDRYLGGIPEDSRAGKPNSTMRAHEVTDDKIGKIKLLSQVASDRGQTMAQLALAWVLRHEGMTSALIGASKPSQIIDCAGASANTSFSDEEIARIDEILK